MADDRIWTADELERLSLDERQQLLNDRVITDPSRVPPDFLERARAHGRALLEERGLIAQQGDGD